MKDNDDVVIVGGAVIGSSVAYFLAANPDFQGSILIVERDPSFRRASTSLSSSSIRRQFSNPVNVRISQFGAAFIGGFAERMQVGEDRPDLGFHEQDRPRQWRGAAGSGRKPLRRHEVARHGRDAGRDDPARRPSRHRIDHA